MSRRPAWVSPRGRWAWIAAAIAIAPAACKSGDPPAQDPPRAGSSVAPSAGPADAAVPDANLDTCRTVAATAPALPAHERAKALLDACQPCGDWDPLLRWGIPAGSGGPSREAITNAMLACKAYCDPNAKQRFLNNLDDARGQDTRKPWRLLGEICGATVSAVPDARYMSPPYFALDRIARALALVAPLQVPLPAITVTGIGIALPHAVADASRLGAPVLTVDPPQPVLGTLPVGELTAGGITVRGDYPGSPVALPALAAALAKLDQPILLLASGGLRATRITAVLTAADGRTFRLAAALPSALDWTVPGAIPIDITSRARGAGFALTVTDDANLAIDAVDAAPAAALSRAPVKLTIDDTATVDGLAQVLAALARRGATSAAVVGPSRKRP